MIIRPLCARARRSAPSANPPISPPSPIAVSMNAYVARYSSPVPGVISRARISAPTVITPARTARPSPWSVFARSTVSWRRNAQPSLRSAITASRLCPSRSAPRVAFAATIGGTAIERDEHGRGEVGHGVEPERERQRRARKTDEQAGERVVDDVGDRLADPHRRVRRQQVLLADDPRQDRHPGGSEEDRDRRDQEHERVGEPDVDQHGDRDAAGRAPARSRSLTTMTSLWSQRST